MIIISQDKSKIINFSRIEVIGQDEDNKKRIACAFNTEGMQLGEYATEGRAKEVLQEIIEKYSSYLELRGEVALTPGGMDIQPNVFNIPKVYMMPEN